MELKEKKNGPYFHLNKNWHWAMLNMGLHLPYYTGWLAIFETITD